MSRGNGKIMYGVIGLGRAGWDMHIAELRTRQDAGIVAVVDSEPSRLDEASSQLGCDTHRSIDGLLEDDRIEVIVIATPSDRHTAETLQALRAGKHVIVEKPMATSTTDARKMIDCAAEAGLQLLVHQQHRFSPLFRYIESVTKSGVLGRIFLIRNHIAMFRRRNDWQTLMKYGGGELNNTGSHFIDQVLQLLGSRVVEVMGDIRRVVSAGDADDHVKVMMRAENGCMVDMEISRAEAIATPVPLWTICGEYGTLTCSSQSATIRWFDPAQAPSLSVVDGPALNRTYTNNDELPWQEQVVSIPDRAERTFYDNVYNVIRRGEAPHVTPESVLEALRVIEMVRASSSSRRVVTSGPGCDNSLPKDVASVQ
jgi:predicted dehydrogenase